MNFIKITEVNMKKSVKGIIHHFNQITNNKQSQIIIESTEKGFITFIIKSKYDIIINNKILNNTYVNFKNKVIIKCLNKMNNKIKIKNLKFIPEDEYNKFDFNTYRNNYDDLKKYKNNYILWCHWCQYGKQEGRIFNKKNIKNELQINSYMSLLNDFCKIYECDKEEINNNKKVEFRYYCYRYLNYMKNIQLPKIKFNLKNEAVLIEYRKYPHIEFILRNNINKLGNNWSYTIICGNLNYKYMLNMVKNIGLKIKVIKSNYDNLNQSTYSKFLASIEFWNLFKGEKVLIYQEDSIIFKSNINDFMKYDYIGAPWPKNQNDNINCVGNGGFSLRNVKSMIEVIKKISIEDTIYESSTINYMKNCGMILGPEDVYFSLNMLRYNIGEVANWETAYKFSSESFSNHNSLGGHNFWINDNLWKKRLHNDIVIQLKPMFQTIDLEHRGGWKSILENFIKNDIYNEESEIIFFDLVEKYFLWNTNFICNKKWIGIIHCTQYTPPYLENININNLFKNQNFLLSLENCVFIISLSEYVSNFLNDEFKKNNLNIKIYTLFHPVVFDSSIPKFSLENFINNKSKKIIQIGQQLRKMSSIYLIKPINTYEKIWLTGTIHFNKCNFLLNQEIKYLNIKNINKNEVIMKYTKNFDEYDDLLSKNIVFIELFDASANNTVLECIVRNTPIIINKLPAVIEYLGIDYPLYFNNLDEINNLLNIENITKATNYLKNMKKDKFQINYFTSQIINIIKSNNSLLNDKTIKSNTIKNIANSDNNTSALILKKNINYEIIESPNKNEINRSLYLFENIINIIKENNIELDNEKIIYHYKNDACNYNGILHPIISHSKKIENNNVILFPLTKSSNYIHWDLQEYLKNPDDINWENKKNIFFFRGINSGNPFDNIEYAWFIDRESRTKLLLKSLEISQEYSNMCDISFYNLIDFNYDIINDLNQLNVKYSKILKKNKTIEDLQKELNIVSNYIKPFIELKEIYQYKFIFCPEGFDVSAQLIWVLASNSVAICPPFTYENNIINPLELLPYVHYVPIKSDYSDLEDIIKWCLNNDDRCKEINLQAKKYMTNFINNDFMKEYQKNILLKLLEF